MEEVVFWECKVSRGWSGVLKANRNKELNTTPTYGQFKNGVGFGLTDVVHAEWPESVQFMRKTLR